MSKTIFLSAFYTQFGTFLDQLVITFPEDTDFPTYKSGLFLLQKTNPKLVPEQIVLHVAPFEATLRARDETFFKVRGFPEYADDNALDLIIQKMMTYWDTLSPENKTVIWEYVTLLLDLAKRCTA
jgi:hypothetical protein